VLNPELLRRDPDRTRAILARRDEDAVHAFDAAVVADDEWRRLTAEVEALRAERKQRSSELRGAPTDDQRAELRALGDRLALREAALQLANAARDKALAWVPNLPDPSVPAGKDDSENEVLRVWGEPKVFDFKPLPHDQLAVQLGILDLEAGARLAGARFYVLKGMGAMLQRALINFMLDLHVREQSYTEMHTPYMVKQEIMYGSGQLPKFHDNLYHDAEDDQHRPHHWVQQLDGSAEQCDPLRPRPRALIRPGAEVLEVAEHILGPSRRPGAFRVAHRGFEAPVTTEA